MNPLSILEKASKEFFWILAGTRIPPNPSNPYYPSKKSSVLLLRPDRLGDFLLSAPAIRSLEKRLGSGHRLTLVAGERNQEAARVLFPKAKVLVFPKAPLKRMTLFLALARGKYDAVIDMHSYPFSTTSALLALLSGAPYRVGFWDRGGFGELSRKVFNLGVAPPNENLHEKEKSLLLIKKLLPGIGKPKDSLLTFPPPSAKVRRSVKAFYARMGLGKGAKVVAIHPTLQKADNRWSQGNYLELVRRLGAMKDVKMVVIHGLGEDGELERFKELLENGPKVYILPQSDIFFILEAAKRFDRLVCNDSGLMHLAAGVTRVLAVFGPSDPRRWGPLSLGRLKHMVFRAKDRHCDSVEPEQVAQAVLRNFNK